MYTSEYKMNCACMKVYVSVCVLKYSYTYTHTDTHIYIYVYIYVYIYTYIHAYMHTYIHTYPTPLHRGKAADVYWARLITEITTPKPPGPESHTPTAPTTQILPQTLTMTVNPEWTLPGTPFYLQFAKSTDPQIPNLATPKPHDLTEGLWCILDHSYQKEPQNSRGNYLGPYVISLTSSFQEHLGVSEK